RDLRGNRLLGRSSFIHMVVTALLEFDASPRAGSSARREGAVQRRRAATTSRRKARRQRWALSWTSTASQCICICRPTALHLRMFRARVYEAFAVHFSRIVLQATDASMAG